MQTSPYEEGNPLAKICLLGEAPGVTEVRARKPFCGPAGYLLENCMHQAKVIRRECYLTNVWEIQVFKNKEQSIVADKAGNVLWTKKVGFTEYGKAMAKPCLERLDRCGANVIVPLGNIPLSLLRGGVGEILKWRGSPLETHGLSRPRKMIPSIHPSASLRGNYLWRYYIESDLEKVRRHSEFPELRLPKRHLIIDPEMEEIRGIMEDYQRKSRLAFDIEVLNNQVSCMSFAPSPDEAICIPFIDRDGGPRWSLEEEAIIWSLVAETLGNPQIMKIGQNIIFDITFLLQQMGIFTHGVTADTMIAHHIIWPDFPKGLDFLTSVHTDEPYYKDDRKLWDKPWKDPEAFWLYNAKDSSVAFEIWEAIQDDLDDGYRQTYDETIEMFDPLIYMMVSGIQVDLGRLKKKKIEATARVRELEDEIASICGSDFNPASAVQCIKYFYTMKGLRPYLKNGRPTCDDKALSRIIRRDNLREARLIQEHRFYSKLISTYLEMKFDPDNRLRCAYNPRGTSTGRLSSSKTVMGTGGNMQNLHPAFKSFLVAD